MRLRAIAGIGLVTLLNACLGTALLRAQQGPSSQAYSIDRLVPAEQRVLPMALSERVRLKAVPVRGMCSTVPAVRAPDGLISGNGKMFVEVFGNPFEEQIVFHQERLVAPWKGAPMEAPKIASVLPEVRRLILAGEYRKANELALAKAQEGPTKPETANLREHPAFTMRIDTPGQHGVHDYLRTIDFESGEVTVRWTDEAGVWERRTFVSRPDNVIVQVLTAPAGAAIHTKVALDTSGILGGPRASQSPRTLTSREGMPRPLLDPGVSEIRFAQSVDGEHVVLQGQYVVEHGEPGYASVTRVIADGGTVKVGGDALVLDGMHSVTLLTRIEAYDDLKQREVDALKAAVDRLAPGYDTLMARHRPGQAAVMDRASLDFGGAAEHSMSGEEMLADQRLRPGYNGALLENIFDMGRYWLYLRSGDFPPIWGM